MEKEHVYCFLANICNAPEVESVDNIGLEPARLERIGRCHNKIERKRLIYTGIFLKEILAEFDLSNKNICYQEKGKPFLKDETGLFFNISHSGDYILIGVSGQNIGIDIQKRVTASGALVAKTTSAAERADRSRHVAACYNELWCIKESYLKLLGVGISKPMSEVTYEKTKDAIVIYENENEAAFSRMVLDDVEYKACVTAKNYFTIANFARKMF